MLALVQKDANAQEAYKPYGTSAKVKVKEKKEEGEDRRACHNEKIVGEVCSDPELHLDTNNLEFHLEIDNLRAFPKVGGIHHCQGGIGGKSAKPCLDCLSYSSHLGKKRLPKTDPQSGW